MTVKRCAAAGTLAQRQRLSARAYATGARQVAKRCEAKRGEKVIFSDAARRVLR